MTSVVAHQVTRPCQRAVLGWAAPHSRPATTPPKNDAMMPDSVHQMPAPMEKVLASGLSAVLATFTAERPTPMPRRLISSWATRAATTPAMMAPQEALLNREVRWASGTGAAAAAEPVAGVG